MAKEDGQHVTFPTSFAAVPTVIVNAALAGKALMAAVVNVTATGFKLRIYDFNNAPVTGNVMVQWIAALPQNGLEMGHHVGGTGVRRQSHVSPQPALYPGRRRGLAPT